jgi:Periplasmic protein involved in polysaccharide export
MALKKLNFFQLLNNFTLLLQIVKSEIMSARTNNPLSKISLVIFSFIIVIMTSCVPQKEILYLKNMQMISDSSNRSIVYQNDRDLDYKVQPGDNLYIRAVSIDEKNANVFNNEGSFRSGGTTTDLGVYLTSYTVNNEGYIDFPMVGKIEVKGLTVEEIKAKTQAIISKYLKETVIMVKLTSFNLTVLGEVKNPGLYKVYQSEINLFEAFAMAGNMTDFAKRNNVKIIRQTPKGSEIILVDMNNADILSSPYYLLQPNDILYVEPLRIKQWGFASFPYSTIISVVTLGLTIITLFKINFMNNNQNPGQQPYKPYTDKDEQSVDIKSYIFKFLSYWYLFAICVFLALVLGFVYSKLKSPVYQAQGTILIKEDKSGIDPTAIMAGFGYGNQQNLQNEIGILKSYSLSERVVKKLNIEVLYYDNSGFKTVEMYKNSPFSVEFEKTFLKQLD